MTAPVPTATNGVNELAAPDPRCPRGTCCECDRFRAGEETAADSASALLLEWLASREAMRAHVIEWEGVDYDTSPERQATWRPICDHNTVIEDRMLAFARKARADRTAARATRGE